MFGIAEIIEYVSQHFGLQAGDLIYTVPFVIYGIFRYLYLLHRRGGGGDPSAALLQDFHLLGAFCAWFASVVLLLR